MKPAWLHRPLLNWQDVYRFALEAGVKKMMPPEQLHMTLATVRDPVDWSLVELQTNELVIPEGFKSVQILGWTVKALTFGHPDIKARHEEIKAIYPQMDHPLLRPHVSLFRGGKLPQQGYLGKLIFGPEILEEFSEEKGRNIKHVKIDTPEWRERLGLVNA